MRLSTVCMNCIIQRQMEHISDFEDDGLKSSYIKNVLSIISNADENDSAPIVVAEIDKIYQDFFGLPFSYESNKTQYNQMMLQKADNIWSIIQSSDDGLLTALRYSRVGNYIDFGAAGSIDNDKLNDMLEAVRQESADFKSYQKFKLELLHANELVYLTDNCGEIVLDKLFIQCIKDYYPRIHVTVIVRGYNVLNDATLQDAQMVGLTEISDVIDNGTAIAGTSLEHIDKKAKACVETADVIISKGQGNFETLNGCGLNIYYSFLCKCEWFVKRFKMERYKGVFVNERDLLNR